MSFNKVALITGSSGISAATAISLVEELGYDGFILGYHSDLRSAKDLKYKLKNYPVVKRVILVQNDLTRSDDCLVDEYVSIIKEQFGGKLTTLIHSAGAYLDTEGSHFKRYFNMYARSFSSMVEACLPFMESGQGKIVALSSPGCNQSQIPRIHYPLGAGMAKASLEYAVRFFAKREAPRRINVNCVIPGITYTKAWKLSEEELKEKAESRSPMKELLYPEDIAKTILFLCSDNSSAITGVSLPVDGGLHLRE